MPRKTYTKAKKKGIPVLVLLGLVVMGLFYYLFGLDMLLRYLLGALMFATITVTMIKWLNGKLGKKSVRLK